MDPEGLLPRLREPATGPCPEQNELLPSVDILFLSDPFTL